MPSKKNRVTLTTAPTTESAFRDSERYWKSRTSPPDLSLALNTNEIIWETDLNSKTFTIANDIRGYWLNKSTGIQLECVKIKLRDGILTEGMGRKKWKGKGKEIIIDQDESVDQDAEVINDYCIIIPSMPGLVLLPSILSPSLQRSLTVESLNSALLPNLTSLSAHYNLPENGLWKTFALGKGDEEVQRIDNELDKKATAGFRQQVDFEPVTKENWKEVNGRGIVASAVDIGVKDLKIEGGGGSELKEEKATIRELLKKLRWTTIGWAYDWTSKTYDFSRGRTPLPPLIYRTCKDAVRAVPFSKIFGSEISSEDELEYEKWSESYEPQAGVINNYQLKDSLTAHIDQSEVDAIRPLISFSIGNSAVFLIGGQTRATVPIAIILASGDGLIMSGKTGRRVFHGLPRVIADSLPSYLASDSKDENDGEEEWKLYGQYLEMGARLNINVRTVF